MIINNLHQLVEEQTEKTPNAIALLYLDKEMTYVQLNEQANQLAHYLYLKNLSPEEPIAICLERCFDLFIAILAVLKVGCAYVPLEPRHPPKRLRGIVEDCQAKILLTQSHLVSAFEPLAVEKVRMDVERDHLRTQATENLDLIITPDHLAYIIYTSGSTGKPKGVCIEHQSVLNLVEVESSLFQINNQSKVLQFTSIGFDPSILEWTLALTHGATLCLLPTSSRKSMLDALNEILTLYPITIAIFTPALLETDTLSPDLLPKLQTLGIGGDVCAPKVISKWAQHARLINLYGPTEATVFSLAFPYDGAHSSATIGLPIKNTVAYLFNEDLQSTPEGQVGEIYIGGICLARGYLNRPESTQKHFTSHPFKPNQRLYKTGDLGRQLPDGTIEYVGRIDEQVKIRGHRIELHEVSNVLLQINGLSEVVTLIDPELKEHLISFIKLDSSKVQSITEDFIVNKVRSYLPEYMIPKTIIFLKEFELNINGKYDREILFSLYKKKKAEKTKNYYIASNRIEEELMQIVYDILQYDQLDAESDLLRSGLDSIMILQFISRANEKGLLIQPKQIYQKKNIRKLALIAQENISNSVDFLPLSLNQYFDLSPIQRCFFQYDFIDYCWVQAGYIEIKDSSLNVVQLERAYQDLAKYHVSLNLCFSKTTEGWQQAYSVPPPSSLPLSVIPIDALSDIKNHTKKLFQAISIKIGLLTQALLFYQSSSNTYYFYLAVHHLAIDGISWRILLEDLSKIYNAYVQHEEPKITQTLPYQVWIEKLHATLKKPQLWEELEYWNFVLRKASTCSLVEKDSEHDRVENRRTLCFSLNREETNALLHEIHGFYHTEINDILLAALAALFVHLRGEQKLAVLLDRHGRETFITGNSDFSRTVGWFTSISPVYLEFEQSTPEYLIPCIKTQLEAIPHRGVGYGLLKYLTGDDPRTAYLRSAKEPQINFNYMGQWNLDFEMTPHWRFMNLEREGIDGKSCTTEDLLLLSCIKDGQFRLFLTYNKVHNNPKSMIIWGKTYLDCLRHLIGHCKGQTRRMRQEVVH